MGETYFTADLHLGHQKVAEMRGFDSTLEHDQTVMGNIYDTLNPNDTLYILGDISLGYNPGAMLYIMALDSVHLVSGNHDPCHPMHRDATKELERYGYYFRTIASQGTTRIDKQKIMLSHYPYAGDHTSVERDEQWRMRDLGAPIIHGHTHSTEKVSRSQRGTLQVCVSVDAWGLRPASKAEIRDIIRGEAG